MALSEFGRMYLESLQTDLTSTDRRTIATLKDLACENPSEAASVVDAIRRHMKTCPGKSRLPTLYLVDYILKSSPPAVYMQLLSQILLELFVYLWDAADAAAMRPQLAKVCKLWRDVTGLDQSVVAKCENYMIPAGQASTSAPGGAAGYAPPVYRGPMGAVPGGLAVAPGKPAVTADPQRTVVVQPAFQPALGPPPIAAAPPAGIIQYIVTGTHAPQVLYATQQFAAPPQVLLPPPSQLQMQQIQPVPQPAVLTQRHALGPGMPSMLPAQPHAGMQAPHVPVRFAAPASPQQPQAGSPAQPDSRSTATHPPHRSQAVQDLLRASARSMPKFLDAAFLRNKRRAANTGTNCRAWYPNVDIWLLGTSGPGDAVEATEEEKNAEAEPQLYFVEEDPSQPECAISGEPFDRFYDPDSDKWCYKDAVLLTGEEAAKYGVMEGSIVKVHCLAGAPSKLTLNGMRTAAASAAAAAGLASAAAAPPAASAAAAAPSLPGGGVLAAPAAPPAPAATAPAMALAAAAPSPASAPPAIASSTATTADATALVKLEPEEAVTGPAAPADSSPAHMGAAGLAIAASGEEGVSRGTKRASPAPPAGLEEHQAGGLAALHKRVKLEA